MNPRFLATLLAAAVSVDAHGFLNTVTIDGKLYTGNLPNANTNPSVIRQVSDISPVKGASNPDLNCGLSATLASLVADANPGSTMAFNWSGGDYQRWPHNTGPMLTYMTSCGSTQCNQFSSSTAKWFKIQQIARKANGDWAQVDIMAGGQATITLPSTLAPGNYLIRHEIIALHNAMAEGGVEFYPACAQLRISGSQTGAPANNELVSLPGAYSDTDPGIWDKSPYDASVEYVFPGPSIAAFVGASGSSGGVQGVPSSTTGGSGTATPTYGVPSSTPTCRLKRSLTAVKKGQGVKARSAIVRRGHAFSNTLRSLFSGHHRRS